MKKHTELGICLAVASGLFGASFASAQADYMPPMSGWPQAIQTAWQVQGEYYGNQTQDATKRLGAWVVANGGTNFGLVLLPGGLLSIPGQDFGGWDQKTRYQGQNGPAPVTLSGKVFKVTTTNGGFSSDSITGSGEDRTLYVRNADGTSYILKRVRRHSPTLGFRHIDAKTLPGASGVISLWDSASGQADLTKWLNEGSAPQVKYKYLYRGVKSVQTFNTVFLHIEFFSPFNPTATGQGRANSGVYMQHHHEAQVLDSFGLSGAQNEFGGIYETKAALVNAALPPQVTLQTYDIYYTPRTSGSWGDSAGAATMTVYSNGVLVQDGTRCPRTTTGASTNPPALQPGPLMLQDHGNEVVYNNIWMIPNATTQNFPYSALLAAAAPDPTALRRVKAEIKPIERKNSLRVFDLTRNRDISGRQVDSRKIALPIVNSVATEVK